MTSYISLSLSDIERQIQLCESELYSFNSSKKKSFGIYYTPSYIVDYIISNSFSLYFSQFGDNVPFILEKVHSLKTDFSVSERAQLMHLYTTIFPRLTVCDPSMGWGVFLLHAYRYLFLLRKNSFLLLSSPSPSELEEESRRIASDIITKSLFGVDLSEQAIQLAQLKLFKEVLSLLDCSSFTFPLPNFKQGNSLLGFASGAENKLSKAFVHSAGAARTIDDYWIELFLSSFKRSSLKEEAYTFLKTQSFVHWSTFAPSGFDLLFGNPPYINVKRLPLIERYIYASLYKTYNSNGDLSNVFWERALSLVKDSGIVSFITPRYWLEGQHSNKLRQFLLTHSRLREVIDFQSNRNLFSSTEKRLGVDLAITTIEKSASKGSFNAYILKSVAPLTSIDKKNFIHKTIAQSSLSSTRWNFNLPKIISYLDDSCNFTLGDSNEGSVPGVCRIGKGCSTGNNAIFTLRRIEADLFEGYKGIQLTVPKSEQRALRALIKNSDIERYRLKKRNQYWIFLKDQNISDFPSIYGYLLNFKDKLSATQKKYKLDNFYDYAAYRSLDLINSRLKIITPYQSFFNKFAFVQTESSSTINEADVITLVLKPESEKRLNWFFLLGILNSELIHYYVKHRNKKIYYLYDFRTNQISSIPLKIPSKQDALSYFSEMLYRLYTIEGTNKKLGLLREKIEFIVNSLVFELYLKEQLSSELSEVLAPLIVKEKGLLSDLESEWSDTLDLFEDKQVHNELHKIYSNTEIIEICKDLNFPYSPYLIDKN